MIKHKLKDITNFLSGAIILSLVLIFSYFSFFKIDLTEDDRFTLNDSTIELISNLDDVVEFKIYLDSEHLPANLTRVKTSIIETIEEFSDLSDGDIEYEFIDIYKDIEDPKAREKELLRLQKKGLQLKIIAVPNLNGQVERIYIPLGAIAFHNGRSITVPFTRQKKGNNPTSYEKEIEELEFEITNGIRKLRQDTMKNVAFLQGHGELGRYDVEDFSKALYEYYQTGPAYLTDKEGNSKINALDGVDLLVIAKPMNKFTQKEQFILDQFIMKGGKVLWMLEGARGAELDSMQTQGLLFPYPLETGLDAMLFKYGVRVDKNIVEDLQCSKIPIQTTANGDGRGFKLYKWIYNPVLTSNNKHLITKNLNPIKLEFASSLDSVPVKGVSHLTLLETSGNNKYKKLPSRITFNETANREIKPHTFTAGKRPIAMLLKGNFNSYFKNRIAPSFANHPSISFKTKSEFTNMIVISDGDICKNWFSSKNEIIPLGTDQFTKVHYDNKKFLVNCANFLLDDEELIEVRSKKIKMRLLDPKLVKGEKSFMQLLNVGLPIALILLFSFAFIFFRKMRFSK